MVVVTLTMVVGLLVAGDALRGRQFELPGWAVATLEDRIGHYLAEDNGNGAVIVTLEKAEIAFADNLQPRLVLRDLRLVEPASRAGARLSEIGVTFSRHPLLMGKLRPRTLKLSGARLFVSRDEQGRLSFRFGDMDGGLKIESAAELIAVMKQGLSLPLFANLRLVEADGIALTLRDHKADRLWQLGDGRFVFENRPDAMTGELSLTLLDGNSPAQARLRFEADKGSQNARFVAVFDNVAAADLAVQAPPLAPLKLVDAPISGQILGRLDSNGRPAGFLGELELGAGSLHASGEGRPIRFDRAGISLGYDPATQRIHVKNLSVGSPSLRFESSGSADLQAVDGAPTALGEWPAMMVTQLDFDRVMIDPEGFFESPVEFTSGRAAIRLKFDPLQVDIGEVLLSEGGDDLRLDGRLEISPEGSWQGAIDVGLNRIDEARLIRLWPLNVVTKTRKWLAENVGQGELFDVTAALRLIPGREPRFALNYWFAGAEVRFLPTLPPISDGRGWASVWGNVYTQEMEGGHVTAPQGGDADVAGSTFQVLDILQKPAQAEVTLVADTSLTAMLSFLDQPPFNFVTKAGRQVDLGEGRARINALLRFPLLGKKLKAHDVSFDVKGDILDFRSDRLLRDHVLTSDQLAFDFTPGKLGIEGRGVLDDVAMTGRYEQGIGARNDGQARFVGRFDLNDQVLRKFGARLPKGWMSGQAAADIDLALTKGVPSGLELSSALRGMRLQIPALGWSKPADVPADLQLEARLGDRREISRLDLSAPGLIARGRLETGADGKFDRAVFSHLQVGKWLDSRAEISGFGTSPRITLSGGTLNLGALPKKSDRSGADKSEAGRGAEITAYLDRLILTGKLALTSFTGQFTAIDGGFDGDFTASVNGAGHVAGRIIPYQGGSAVRIISEDAGLVLAASGIFTKGQGGRLDMTIQPDGLQGHYRGVARFTDLSVQDAPAALSLLSASSVVGLFEQFGGRGVFFQNGEVAFRLTPEEVEITHGAATGASIGISFDGIYRNKDQSIDIQGVVSPIFFINGIGQAISRKGEGIFGFTFRMTGQADSLRTSVNPISFLAPGILRDIFRRPTPSPEAFH